MGLFSWLGGRKGPEEPPPAENDETPAEDLDSPVGAVRVVRSAGDAVRQIAPRDVGVDFAQVPSRLGVARAEENSAVTTRAEPPAGAIDCEPFGMGVNDVIRRAR